MRERMKKKKNMIIGGLLALIFVMSVGYAAFATNLNISGTANTSSWIIKITNIREKTHIGEADTVNTSFTDLSATFSSTLTKPGDSVTYEVTVENQGNIDASLKKVTKTFSNNQYIDVTYSGLLEGQMLYKQGQAGSSAVMEVTVTFKDVEIEKLSSGITSNITISLDFEQEGNNVDTTKKYLIEYDSDGGFPVESRYASWDEQSVAFNVTPRRLGYNFIGWYTGRGGSGTRATVQTAGELIGDESLPGVTLYASWTLKRYTIIYNTQGGYQMDNSYKGYTDQFSLNIPMKDGYIFEGWYTSPNGEGLKITNSNHVYDVIKKVYGPGTDVAGGTNGNEVTLYAKWKENEYTEVIFHAQDSKKSRASNMPDDKIVKCTDTNFIDKTPTREGYTFDGWLDDLDNSITNQSVKDIYGYCPDQTYVYASWTSNS